MPIVGFKGLVLPPIHKLNIALPKIEWRPANSIAGDVAIDFSITVTNSQVSVLCELDSFNFDAHFPFMLMRVNDLTRAAISCFCFAKGVGQTLFIHTFVDPNGVESVIAPKMESLSVYCTAFDLSSGNTGKNSYEAMWKLMLAEPALFMALDDLIASITTHHHAPINCARAIEGLRTLIVPAGMDRKQGWPLMRERLNLEQSYVTFITDTSTGPRHGDRTHIPGSTVDEIVQRSWIIMNRFLEYRKRGNQKLPIVHFPVLTN